MTGGQENGTLKAAADGDDPHRLLVLKVAGERRNHNY